MFNITTLKHYNRNELTCDICVDVMTDLDEFITSDTTEEEIVNFVKQV